jgi:O-acetylhomoserine/O-acetylserine sulfhydrylase-like pyridoxal-dependent enzyme
MTEGLSTRCVHAGECDDAHGSPHTPIYTTAAFKLSSTAALLARSIRTLPVRVRQQNAMARHPRIGRVLYPGLPDFPGHDLAQRQMGGFGGPGRGPEPGTRMKCTG